MHTKMNYKKVLFVLFIFSGCFLLFVWLTYPKIDYDLSKFSMDNLSLPTSLNYVEENIVVKKEIDWEIDNTNGGLNIFPDPKFSGSIPIEQLKKGWFVRGVSKNYFTKIYIDIINYQHPILNGFYYWYLEPKHYYSSSVCWNPTYEPEKYIPKVWKGKNEFTKIENIYCCNGDEHSCDSWNYQEKYGQYYINIHSSGYGSDIAFFSQVIDTINHQLFRENINFGVQ